MMLEKIQAFLSRSASTAATLMKIPLMSGRPFRRGKQDKGTIVIMGNGPSLREAVGKHRDRLMSRSRMAVNLAALAPGFDNLRPQYYILADVAFFAKEQGGKMPDLWRALGAVEWPMTLFVPAKAVKMPQVKSLPPNVTVKPYNLTPAEGFEWFLLPLYDSGLAMPRPRNVLVPAIVCAVREGFTRIVLTGADHNWSKTLWVTERNRVVMLQPHFYEDDDAELKRAEEFYRNVRIHEIYNSYAVAFGSYHRLLPWLKARGAEVLNATPGSFIDAFRRIPPAEM